MNDNCRIKLTDSVQDAVIKLSDGNPGALRVCMEILQKGELIDPASALGGFGALLTFDTFEIYGSKIWMLYKDVCKENLVMTLAVLRACQLGYISWDELSNAIDNYGDGIDVESLYNQVKERLTNFASAEKPSVTFIDEGLGGDAK